MSIVKNFHFNEDFDKAVTSPLLFNACGEAVMQQVKETLDERSGDIVDRRSLWNIRYADDRTLISCSKTELERRQQN